MYWFHDLDMTLGEKIDIAKYVRHVLHACSVLFVIPWTIDHQVLCPRVF